MRPEPHLTAHIRLCALHRFSATATKILAGADQLAVAAIIWFELTWRAAHERIVLTIP